MERRQFLKESLLLGTLLGTGFCSKRKGDDLKVVVLGFDGANWPTLDPLLQAGHLPFLNQLKQRGAWANFKTFKPTKSSVIWTSIATGKSMVKHGIYDFAYVEKNNLKIPFSGAARREPAIWQILDQFKKESVVVNWWVSHPPDKIKGVMVSDYFRRIIRKKYKKNNHFEPFKGAVHPPSWFTPLTHIDMPRYRDVLKTCGLPNYPALFKGDANRERKRQYNLMMSFPTFARMDAFVENVSMHLFQKKESDFFATYFRLPDVVQHFITLLLEKDLRDKILRPLPEPLQQELTLKIAHLLLPIYQYMERIIQWFITQEQGKNTYFLIMSDHGFSFYPGGYNHYNLPPDQDPPEGIFLALGPKVKPGQLRSAGVMDVAPSILYLYDLPLGKAMDGKPLIGAFNLSRNIKYQAYKMPKGRTITRDKKYEEEALKELKSLGYIGQ